MKVPACFLSLVLLVSCAGPATAPLPDAAMSARSGVKLTELQRGHSVYLAHCGRCHEPILPQDVSRKDWHVVTPGMAWNAGISAQDESALTSYLLSAAR